jgi:hypothetical protein
VSVGIIASARDRGEALDPTIVQARLIQKWSDKVREEKKAYDTYMRYVGSIESAFREI